MSKLSRKLKRAISKLSVKGGSAASNLDYLSEHANEIDLSFSNLLKEADIDTLRNEKQLHDLLLKMGLNNEMLKEFPAELYQYTGYGLLSWQYPNQLIKLLLELSRHNIKSYLEIGTRHGGTFVIIYEYLKRFNAAFEKAVAVDIVMSDTLKEFASNTADIDYKICSSMSEEFTEYMNRSEFDLIMIDGDHSLKGCKNDFESVINSCKMIIFHDIASIETPGVCATWQHFKAIYGTKYTFCEYIDQYNDVYIKTGNSYLGIGLAIKND